MAESTPEQREKFFNVITNTRVSAVGEVGLDISRTSADVKQQENFLIEVLERARPHIPLILHIRSFPSDIYSSELYNRALGLLKSCCQRDQIIVLHCFTGDSITVAHWRANFTNTYFGFTHIITKFDQKQLRALRDIPEDRLLAETDAPYMPPRDIRLNSPIYVGEVIEKMATMRYTTTGKVASDTLRNALNLFGP